MNEKKVSDGEATKGKEKQMAKKAVEAPKGFHWMKSGAGYKLMKNPATGYKPHKNASKKASFEVQKVHK